MAEDILKVATANWLKDGAVVYRNKAGGWSRRLDDALAAGEDLAAELLAASERDAERSLIVAPYLIEVTRQGSRLQPTSLRERIRAEGPSIPYAAELSHA